MRQVVLFKATDEKVIAYGDYLPIMTYDPPLRCRNSGDIFITSEVNVYNAYIHRFVESDKYGYTEKFVAFDPALQSIIDHLIYAEVEQETSKIEKIKHAQIKLLEDKIKILQSRTIWSMIFSKFKRSN